MRTVAAESLLEWVTLGEWRCVLCEGGGCRAAGNKERKKSNSDERK